MFALLCSWLIQTLVFLSWGNMLVALWSKLTNKESKLTLFDTFWIGICAIGAVVSILSILIPLSFNLLVGVVSISLVYLLLKRKAFMAKLLFIVSRLKEAPLWMHISLIIAFVAISLFALTTPLLYDEGLYHLQTMLWSEQCSVIPGLGNLHGRLAFNSNFLLLSTLFNYHPDSFLPFFSINSLALIVFATWVITKVYVTKQIVERGILILVLLLLIFSFGIYLSSTSTDILANIIIVYLLLSCILDKDTLNSKTLLLFALPLFCVTLKLSSALIVILSLFVLVCTIRNKNFRQLYVLLGLGFVIGLPWLTRFVILSGYLVYPFPSVDIFTFDWKIPIELVQLEKDLAFVWPIAATMPVEDVLKMSISEWFPLWKSGQSLFILALYTLALISPLIVLVNFKEKKMKARVIGVWIIALLGCLFGFLSAPDPRFSFGFIICAGLIPLSLFGRCQGNKKIFTRLSDIMPIFLVIGLLGLVYVGYNQTKYYQSVDEPIHTLLVKPQTIDYKKLEKASKFREKKINNTIFYYPDNSNQCFDHSLPCLPHPNDKLEMRGEHINDGFRITK